MAYKFFVIMQKRIDNKIYTDLHKTDERIYFSYKEAEEAIIKNSVLENSVLERSFHIVPLIALTEEEFTNQKTDNSSFLDHEKNK